MATSRNERHTFESQFPIVATNLRALVSSWLPPAREPSPVDDERAINGETEGRPERLALGATLSVSQPSTQFQNRMNRKLGIPAINGAAKTDGKKMVNGKGGDRVNGNGKRLAETESDSEEDSRSKLIKKKGMKKGEQDALTDKKKKISVSHKAINPAISHAKSSPAPVVTNEKTPRKVDRLPSEDQQEAMTINEGPPSTTEKAISLSLSTKSTSLPTMAEIRDGAAAEQTQAVNETAEERKRRLKREKKKEKKRLKRLEKEKSQG